jgi:hypothetical protein
MYVSRDRALSVVPEAGGSSQVHMDENSPFLNSFRHFGVGYISIDDGRDGQNLMPVARSA